MYSKLKAGMLFPKSAEKKCVKSLSVLNILNLGCNPLPGVRVCYWINHYATLVWFCWRLDAHTKRVGRLDRVATVCREVCLTNYTISHLVERSYVPLVACISCISLLLSSECLMSVVYIIFLYATEGTTSLREYVALGACQILVYNIVTLAKSVWQLMCILSDFIPIFVSYLPVSSVLVSFFVSFCSILLYPVRVYFCLFFFGGGGLLLSSLLLSFVFIFVPLHFNPFFFSISLFPISVIFQVLLTAAAVLLPRCNCLSIFLPNAKRHDAVRNIGPPRFINP